MRTAPAVPLRRIKGSGEVFVTRVQHRIVLINGQRFADLMLKHGVGVRVRATYTIQTVDEDYFS